MKLHALCTLTLIAALPACDSSSSPEPRGYEIQVAPLDLPDIVDTCYRATVFNTTDVGLLDADHTVWSQSYICATQYGDNLGSLTYIGTCDADGGTPQNPVFNTVELELQSILVADANGGDGEANNPATPWNEITTDTLVSPKDFFNPCQAPNYCRLQRPCVENQDTLVEFNLTVMRSARQGFFDIAVNFEDVFCSAKFDCQYPDVDGDDIDEAISLLFDGDGNRRDTAVLGFACSAGEATALSPGDTYLYMDDFTVSCSDDEGDVVWEETFPSAGQSGNQFFPPRPMEAAGTTPNSFHCVCANGSVLDTCESTACDPGTVGNFCQTACGMAVSAASCEAADAVCGMADPVFQYGIYQGNEFVDADFTKVYWNLAIGFNVAAMQGLQCTFTTKASASDDDGNGRQGLRNNVTEEGAVYPYLVWNINLNDIENPGSGLTCGQNPVGPAPGGALFYDDSGLRPRYTQLPDETVEFDNCGHDDGSGFATHDGLCDPLIQN